jgi:hypothetical protein
MSEYGLNSHRKVKEGPESKTRRKEKSISGSVTQSHYRLARWVQGLVPTRKGAARAELDFMPNTFWDMAGQAVPCTEHG